MPTPQHPLERRAARLADAVGKRIDIVSRSLGGPQGRPAFTELLSDRDALAFWRRHRHDAIGQQWLQRMQPRDIVELDLALQRALDAEQAAGLPMVSEPGGMV